MRAQRQTSLTHKRGRRERGAFARRFPCENPTVISPQRSLSISTPARLSLERNGKKREGIKSKKGTGKPGAKCRGVENKRARRARAKMERKKEEEETEREGGGERRVGHVD